MKSVRSCLVLPLALAVEQLSETFTPEDASLFQKSSTVAMSIGADTRIDDIEMLESDKIVGKRQPSQPKCIEDRLAALETTVQDLQAQLDACSCGKKTGNVWGYVQGTCPSDAPRDIYGTCYDQTYDPVAKTDLFSSETDGKFTTPSDQVIGTNMMKCQGKSGRSMRDLYSTCFGDSVKPVTSVTFKAAFNHPSKPPAPPGRTTLNGRSGFVIGLFCEGEDPTPASTKKFFWTANGVNRYVFYSAGPGSMNIMSPENPGHGKSVTSSSYSAAGVMTYFIEYPDGKVPQQHAKDNLDSWTIRINDDNKVEFLCNDKVIETSETPPQTDCTVRATYAVLYCDVQECLEISWEYK